MPLISGFAPRSKVTLTFFLDAGVATLARAWSFKDTQSSTVWRQWLQSSYARQERGRFKNDQWFHMASHETRDVRDLTKTQLHDLIDDTKAGNVDAINQAVAFVLVESFGYLSFINFSLPAPQPLSLKLQKKKPPSKHSIASRAAELKPSLAF